MDIYVESNHFTNMQYSHKAQQLNLPLRPHLPHLYTPAEMPSSPLLQSQVTYLYPQYSSQPSTFAIEVTAPVSPQLPSTAELQSQTSVPFLQPWEKLHKISIKPAHDSSANSFSATPTILDEV